MCVAIPIYYSTGSKWKGFLAGVLSGVSEVLGGLVGYAVIATTPSSTALAVLFGLVAGMMTFIRYVDAQRCTDVCGVFSPACVRQRLRNKHVCFCVQCAPSD
jgi:hypothetical protein